MLFKLSDEQWQRLQEILERPARDLPKLRELLERKFPWDEE